MPANVRVTIQQTAFALPPPLTFAQWIAPYNLSVEDARRAATRTTI
ncbi:MAG: hypothetical protein R3F11_33080 [Verrucomicrobiales bacterium]